MVSQDVAPVRAKKPKACVPRITRTVGIRRYERMRDQTEGTCASSILAGGSSSCRIFSRVRQIKNAKIRPGMPVKKKARRHVPGLAKGAAMRKPTAAPISAPTLHLERICARREGG